MQKEYDVIIVGGGASGLAAAVELKMSSPELSVLVIEKMKEPARKLRATGSGRCNITNTKAAGYDRIMSFFDDIGLVTRTYENGLVYPYSESASDAADLLTARAKSLGAEICCGEEVVSAERKADRFEIESVYKDESGEKRSIRTAKYMILAMGGKAGPNYGTTGDGYRIARDMGHSIVTPVPVLTGIECREWDEDREASAVSMAGCRSRCRVSLYKNENNKLFEEEGELQLTSYGLSGICIFNMTRYMRYDRAEGEEMDDFTVCIDLYPDGDIREALKERRTGRFSSERTRDVLCSVLKYKIAEYVMEYAEDQYAFVCGAKIFSADMPLAALTDGEIDLLAESVHELKFHPVRLRGWKDAQVTSGGVAVDELDEKTSESRIVPGLYITGELADRDFSCGGYNLSNAWLTGLAAADDISKNEVQT